METTHSRIEDVMTVRTARIRQDSNIHHAAEIVALSGVSDLMVVDEDDKFVGVISEGDILRTVNLESSAVIRELGVRYILGGDEDGVHSTYGPSWKELPDYGELKRLVVLAAQGKLREDASSR